MPKPHEGSHIALVQRACEGDKQAFAALYDEYQLGIYEYLAGHVGKDEAYDLLQDTFIRALTGISSLQDASKFAPWLYRIARNRAYDYLRHKRRYFLQSFEDLSEMTFDHVDFTEHVTQQELIQQALASLPLLLRDCLLLRAVGGFSSCEIASIFELKEGSVNTYLSKARQLFRETYLYLMQRSNSPERGVESDGE